MLKRLSIVLVLGLCYAGILHAKPAQIKDTVKKSFDVQPGGTVYLDLDHGNIEVETGDDERVLIALERIADADSREEAEEILAYHDYTLDQQGADVRIRSRFDGERSGFISRWRRHNNLKIRVIVQVPTRYNIEFSSGAGNVAIKDVMGTIKGRTGAGNIDIEAVKGPVEISSGAGNVEINGDITWADVNTGAGNISLEGAQGAVKAHTGAGNVYAEILGQPDEASLIKSGAGNVTVSLDENISAYVDGSASMGNCDTEFPLKVQGKWLNRSFSGRLNGGGPEIRLAAGVGNVSLKKH